MAIVGHSYFYHTRKDIVKNIEVGSSQHFTSNAMAILDYLLSPESPLGSDKEWSPPDVVYMSLYDRIFLTWSMKKADFAYIIITTIVGAVALANLRSDRAKAFGIALLGAPLGLVGGLLSANLVAGVMTLLGRQMGW